MNKIIFTLIGASLVATGAYGQTTQRFSASKANDYGIVYSLPKTVLDITIEAEHVVKTPGEFYKYTKKYLKNETPIAEPSESWTVKSVHVNARGIPNQDEQYLMQFKGGSSPFVIMSDTDLPLAINTEDVTLPESPVLPLPVKAAPTPLETDAARYAVSEEMMQSQSSAKKAELAAQRIFELRQSRTDYITGQADQMPPDGAALKIIMDQISAQEAALTAMFLGTEKRETAVRTFTIIPDGEVNREVIARISAIDGIVNSENLAGDPMFLSLNITERGKIPLNDKGEPKEFPKGGVAYCIPGSADVRVSYGDEVYWNGAIDMGQFGVVYGLDPKLFNDKKAPSYLILDPVTGGIKELGTK